MSLFNPHFNKSETLNDFIFENAHNQIIFGCLKKNTELSDETILNGFKEAYRIGSEVVTDVSLYTFRSKSFLDMASRFSQEALLAHSICYALLSFHSESPRLGQYLANIKPALEFYCNDIFQPILLTTVSLAPILPGSVTFPPRDMVIPASATRPKDEELHIPVSVIFTQAKKLPKNEATVVLNLLMRIIADSKHDWQEIIRLEIDHQNAIPDTQFQSKYKIAEGQTTNFCKVIKAMYQARMFTTIDSFIPTNQESLTKDFAAFLNTEIRKPSSLLSQSKNSNNFLDIFYTLLDEGKKYLMQEDVKANHLKAKHNTDDLTLF